MEKVTEETVVMIVNYFDSMKWKYDVREDEDMFIFNTGYQGENESIYIRVLVLKGRKRNYHITCSPETTIPKEHILKGLRVINRYNLKAIRTTVCLDEEKGDILFWSHQESNETLTDADFVDCFGSVIEATDRDTAQIFKETVAMKDEDLPNCHSNKKGFFRRLLG